MAWGRGRISSCMLCIFLTFTGSFFSSYIFGQSSGNEFLISQISFEGNRRTQDSTLLREMSIREGDLLSIEEITRQLNAGKDRLTNLGLFTDVSGNLHFDEENPDQVKVLVKVKEGLFFIPIPIIELADRNFNVWWSDHNRDFKYVNLGTNLKLKNITGNADELSLLAQWGYDRKFFIRYWSPYFDQERKWRFSLEGYYASNKEVITLTENGKPEYLRNPDEYLLSRIETKMSFLYRPYLKRSYIMTFGYYYNSIADEVFELNPDFFNHYTYQRYSQVKFQFYHEERNNKYFATSGWYLYLAAIKNGWLKSDQLNSVELEGDLHHHLKLNDYWSWNNSFLTRLRFSDKRLPYYDMNNLSNEQIYVRGYEYYHIEGNNIGILKTSISRKVVDRPVRWGRIMPFTNYKEMNTKLFLSLNFDYGYVGDDHYRTSDFVNKNLYGGGLGLNLLFYNKFSCSFELSMNQKKEAGLFFHINQNFR